MKIIRSGFSSRYVDLGRQGHQHKGYAQTGALDVNSHILANTLLAQDERRVCIEVLLGGFEAIASQNMSIAVTGAITSICIDGQEQAMNKVLQLIKGERLSIGRPEQGARNYIASSLGFNAPLFLGSACPVKRESTGGAQLNGHYINDNDVLSYEAGVETGYMREMPAILPSNSLCTPIQQHYTIRATMAYQAASFDKVSKSRFFGQQYTLGNEVNSMGMRLSGKPIASMSMALYSEGIANGAIQITPEGQPIVMLCERQTIGGYPKIASVISNDLPMLGQCLPGTTIQFEECDVLSARQIWLLARMKMSRFKQKLSEG